MLLSHPPPRHLLLVCESSSSCVPNAYKEKEQGEERGNDAWPRRSWVLLKKSGACAAISALLWLVRDRTEIKLPGLTS
ncbi:unnamed protein product [Ectocarpus sp. 12 AP-2014]